MLFQFGLFTFGRGKSAVQTSDESKKNNNKPDSFVPNIKKK